MKKLLYGTTALVAAGVISGGAAVAAEMKKPTPIEISVGGTFNAEIYYSTQSDNTAAGGVGVLRNHGLKREAEIRFRGQTTLDNGLIVGVRVNFEAETCADQVDESWIFFDSHEYGRVEIGNTDLATTKMIYGAPNILPNHWTGIHNIVELQKAPGQPGLGIDTLGRLNVADDSEHLTYFTPRIAGFQLGVSYVPDNCQENEATTTGVACGGSFAGLQAHNTAGQQSQIWDVGLNYVNKFGDFGVGIYGGYWHGQLENPAALAATSADKNEEIYGFGASVDYAGFTVGGHFRHDNGGCSNCRTIEYYGGVKYVTGPWGFGFEGGEKKVAQGFNNNGVVKTTAISGDDRLRELNVGATYALGPGITTYGGLIFKKDADGTAGVPGTSGVVFLLCTQLLF